MEQESDRLERHIEQTRENLGRNLNELESRVRSTFDWRTQFDKNPWLVLALTFSGGVAVSALLSGSSGSAAHFQTSATYNKFSRTWGNIQSAVIASATKRVESFLEEVLPGFREEYQAKRDEASSRENWPAGKS